MKGKKRFLDEVQDRVEEFSELKRNQVRAVTFQAFREIMFGSPVDTGRFRSNWMISFGTSTDLTITDENQIYRANSKDDPPDPQQINDGLTTINQLGTDKGKGTMFITNNLPYAERLESGHSAQNEGFVEAATENLRSRLKAIDLLDVNG